VAFVPNTPEKTFPFPTGSPTVWTYVSVPTSLCPGTLGGPLAVTTFLPLLLVGHAVTSALEAGFLEAPSWRIDEVAGRRIRAWEFTTGLDWHVVSVVVEQVDRDSEIGRSRLGGREGELGERSVAHTGLDRILRLCCLCIGIYTY
jgi:hypothetical protein